MKTVLHAVAASLLATALSGCGGEPGGLHVFVADPDARSAAIQAASDWNACGGRQVWIEGSPDDDAVPLVVEEARDAALAGAEGVTLLSNHTWSPATTHMEVLRATLSTPDRLGIVAHEIGHVLLQDGSHHATGVMIGGTPIPPGPTQYDCENLLHRW